MDEVVYRSAVRGWDDESDKKPTTLYIGLVQRLRRSDLDKHGDEAFIASVAEAQLLFGPRTLSDGVRVERDPARPVERYDVFASDAADQDILVMWRIPMRPVEE